MYFFKNGTGWCVRHNSDKQQATSAKPQAPIFRKIQAVQAASDKRQAPSSERQASSRKRQALLFVHPHKVSSS